MRVSKLAPGALVVASLLAVSTASAQPVQQGFALDRFNPSERGSEWFVLDSLDLRGKLRPAAGVVSSYAYHPLVAYDGGGNYVEALVRHQVTIEPGASLVLADRFRVAASLPLVVFQNGRTIVTDTMTYKPPSGDAGDLRLSGDVRLFGIHGGYVTGALGAAVYLPTGSREDYTSDGTVRFAPRASVAGDVSLFTYSARLAFQYRPLTERFERNPLGSELSGGVAAGVRVWKKRLVVGPEVYGSSIVDSDSFGKRRGTPLEGILGSHVSFGDLRVGGGAGMGITRGWGTPAVRAFLSAEYAPGIKEPEKARPLPPPPPPPPSDRDGDAIPDETDACPDAAGAPNEDPKLNGCPPVPPPPPDRDGDGVSDKDDACPDVPGQPSADKLSNGCPPDRDGDGVADDVDACPDAPGPGDPDPKRNGCPLARIENGQIKIVEQVKFKFGSAEILRDSDPTLLAVATTLKTHPEITKVRVEGHTDNKGTPAANAKLSQKRADAVVAALVAFGLDKKRFEAKGLGLTRPIDTNDTDEGRQNNRRVELHIAASSEATKEPGALKQ